MNTPTSAITGSARNNDGARRIQQIEGGLIVVLSITATIVVAPSLWWVPLATFLLFDLSMLGYLRSPAMGAVGYNAVHTYAWPAALGAIAFATTPFSAEVATWSGIIAFSWAFHVGVDRMLGYGLKMPDAFTHTHMGWIGRDTQ